MRQFLVDGNFETVVDGRAETMCLPSVQAEEFVKMVATRLDGSKRCAVVVATMRAAMEVAQDEHEMDNITACAAIHCIFRGATADLRWWVTTVTVN